MVMSDWLTATSCVAMRMGTPLMLSTVAFSCSSRSPSSGSDGSAARCARVARNLSTIGGTSSGYRSCGRCSSAKSASVIPLGGKSDVATPSASAACRMCAPSGSVETSAVAQPRLACSSAVSTRALTSACHTPSSAVTASADPSSVRPVAKLELNTVSRR